MCPCLAAVAGDGGQCCQGVVWARDQGLRALPGDIFERVLQQLGFAAFGVEVAIQCGLRHFDVSGGRCRLAAQQRQAGIE